MNNKTIVLFPTETEAKKFREFFPEKYIIAITGIGTAECAAATAAAIVKHSPSTAVLAGIAGAYPDSGIEKGETVYVKGENSADLGAVRDTGFCPITMSMDERSTPADNFYEGETLTTKLRQSYSNTVNTAGTSYINHLLRHKGEIENMEGAGFFAVCRALGVRPFEIRTVSNIVGEPRGNWMIGETVEKLARDLHDFLNELETEIR